MKHPLVLALVAAAVLPHCADARPADCTVPPETRSEIERTIHAFFDALRTEDDVSFRHLTTESFYSFDGGRRFAGAELVGVVRQAHARGMQLNWSIGPMDTTLRCDVAWSAWENVGSTGVPPDLRPARWLESAVLVHQNGHWRVDFFHSQRAAEK